MSVSKKTILKLAIPLLISFSLLITKGVSADGTCPATHPYSYDSVNSPNPTCVFHGLALVVNHYCCQYPTNTYSCSWNPFNNPPCQPIANCSTNYYAGTGCTNINDRDLCRDAGPFNCTYSPETCTGVKSGETGECKFITCGLFATQDGVNPPDPVCSSFGYKCCFPIRFPTPIPRPPLDPSCGSGGIDTAIGCIPVRNTNDFIGFMIRLSIGMGGGIALVLIAVSGFMITTSGGDREKLQAGKELLTSALIGLGMIIFSVFILDLIGVRILRIPGL